MRYSFIVQDKQSFDKLRDNIWELFVSGESKVFHACDYEKIKPWLHWENEMKTSKQKPISIPIEILDSRDHMMKCLFLYAEKAALFLDDLRNGLYDVFNNWHKTICSANSEKVFKEPFMVVMTVDEDVRTITTLTKTEINEMHRELN